MLRKSIIAVGVTAATLIGSTAFAAQIEPGESVKKDPMDNDLFEVVAQIDADKSFYAFDEYLVEEEPYEITSADDMGYLNRKGRLRHYSVDLNGKVTDEYLTDFLPIDEVRAKEKEYVDYDFDKEYEERFTVYNDGLVCQHDLWRFKDINGNEYLFCDDAWVGYGYDYNLGLMNENWTEVTYHVDAMNEFGDTDTTFYTVFSNDVNYTFPAANILSFDDNGYSFMDYNDKHYIIKLKRGFIPTVFYNGEKIKFDQIPVIDNGRTLVPLRAIFEKLGAEVDWNGDTQTVTATKGDTSVSLTINNTTAAKNGEAVTLDVPAKIIGGRTLVPVRFVSDCFGVDVKWDGTMKRVDLTSKE